MKMNPAREKKTLHGIGAAGGIVIGKAHTVDHSRVRITYQYLISDVLVEREVERFKAAVSAEEERLFTLKSNIPEKAKEASFILDSHLMILRDSMLFDTTVQKIREEKINAEWALRSTYEELKKIFDQIEDDYIKSRVKDVEDVTERILRNLSGQEIQGLSGLQERVIIVAHDLSPADTTELNISRVMGFITDVGGRTSHTAIIAQAFEIPAVVGLESATAQIQDGDLLVVDGYTGEVLICPDDSDIIHFHEKQIRHQKYKAMIAREGHAPAVTLDGHRIQVMANIELLEEVTAVRDFGADGIGLYRTEYLYLLRKGFPSEEDLFEDYKEVVELVAPDPAVIRTLDLGGDKFPYGLEIKGEANPALGLRGIRFCLKEPEIFKTQLRAVMRASVYGKVELMFPMISGLQELLDAKRLLEEVKTDLDRRHVDYDHNTPVGIMIEVPSAVAIAELLAPQVDFFSIGTNDLIQYALAIDRVNEHVAFMYQPFHPAIPRMIRDVVKAGEKAGIRVSLCGEMAGDPLCASLLVGMGIKTLSTNARVVPLIKKLLRAMSMEEARQDYRAVMELPTAREVRDYLLDKVRKRVPTLYEEGFLSPETHV